MHSQEQDKNQAYKTQAERSFEWFAQSKDGWLVSIRLPFLLMC